MNLQLVQYHPIVGHQFIPGLRTRMEHEGGGLLLRTNQAGFRVSFMTNSAPIRPGGDLLQLQRTNVVANDPPALLLLSLSGFFDAF